MTFNHRHLSNSLSPASTIVIAFIWFTFPFFILGKYSLVVTFDTSEILVSGLASLSLSEASDLWNRFSMGGTDVRSLGYTAWLNVLFFNLLPPWAAYQVLVLSQFAAAMAGAYLVSSRILKIDPWFSIIPALVYGVTLDGLLIQSVAAFLPLLLYSVFLVLNRVSDIRRWLFLVIVSILISDTAYFSQFFLFPSLLIIGWFLVVDPQQGYSRWLILAGIATALLSLRYGDLIAIIHQAHLSHIPLLRTLPSLDTILAWPVLLRGPINTSATIMLIFALGIDKSRPRIITRLAIFIVLAQLAEPTALALQSVLGPILPIVRGFQVQRIFMVTELALWCSTAYSAKVLFETWRGSSRTNLLRVIAPIILAGAILSFVFQSSLQKFDQAFDWISHGNFVHNYQSPAIEKIAKLSSEEAWPSRADSFQMYPTYLQSYGLETVGGYQPIYNRRYYEFWSSLVEPWMKNSADVPDGQAWWRRSQKLMDESDGWPAYRGVRVMMSPTDHAPRRYLGELYNLNLLSFVGVRWIFSRDKLLDNNLVEIVESPQPWSELSRLKKIERNLKSNFMGRQNLYIYENRNRFPRFYSPTNVRLFDSGRATLEAMSQASLRELESTLFVTEHELEEALSPERTYEKVEIKPVSYRNDKIVLSIKSESGGIVVGQNAYSPYWAATVDGKPTKVFPANHAFWGVKVDKGVKELVFTYEPPYR